MARGWKQKISVQIINDKPQSEPYHQQYVLPIAHSYTNTKLRISQSISWWISSQSRDINGVIYFIYHGLQSAEAFWENIHSIQASIGWWYLNILMFIADGSGRILMSFISYYFINIETGVIGVSNKELMFETITNGSSALSFLATHHEWAKYQHSRRPQCRI